MKIRISRLILDERIYPRERVNRYHVDEIVEARRAGKKMPPVTADKASLKVIDGRHRIEAERKLSGDKATIEVELKEYTTEREMFEDAIRLNASHGETLSPMDQTRCLARAETLGIDQVTVARLLNITTERARDLVSSRLATSADGPVVLKASTSFMAGRKLSTEEVGYNQKAGGLPQTFYINQVIAMLESDAVNWDDQRVANGLKKLAELLDKSLKAVV